MLNDAQFPGIGPAFGARVLGVIPARLGSSRLPGKPLRLIAGRPLIEWVWRRANSMEVLDRLVVATHDPEIARAVEGFGGQAELTSRDHSSGTERVAEVARRPRFAGFDYVLNLQGDEPFLPRGAALAALEQVRRGWDVGTAAVPIQGEGEWLDPAVVKVAGDDRGGAVYFSRAPVPYGEVGDDSTPIPVRLRHVGIYAFTPASLQTAASLPRNRLEDLESLEQLRWLAAGIEIGVAVLDGGSPGIDTEADLDRAEKILQGRGEIL